MLDKQNAHQILVTVMETFASQREIVTKEKFIGLENQSVIKRGINEAVRLLALLLDSTM
jgi:L-lysine 2,3-aminomutase